MIDSFNKKSEESETIRIYTKEFRRGFPRLRFLDGMYEDGRMATAANLWNMFQGEGGTADFNYIHMVSDPSASDFILLPHNYFPLFHNGGEDAKRYIASIVALSKKYKKKILVFSLTDSDEHIDIPDAFIFRYSQYGYKKRENEIIMPPYTRVFRSPGLASYREQVWKDILPREKFGKPTISFCGWADFPNAYRRCTYIGRVLFADIKKYLLKNTHAELHKPGIYFRRKAVNVFGESVSFDTNFTLRKSFSSQNGFDGESSVGAENAEREYIESILGADFVLAPKGMANASIRLFETLSLGRLPVLINTDCVLPLEEHIDYDKFIVRVDHAYIEDAEKIVLGFYNSLSPQEFTERQKMAREAFELLRPGSFLKIVLGRLKRDLAQ